MPDPSLWQRPGLICDALLRKAVGFFSGRSINPKLRFPGCFHLFKRDKRRSYVKLPASRIYLYSVGFVISIMSQISSIECLRSRYISTASFLFFSSSRLGRPPFLPLARAAVSASPASSSSRPRLNPAAAL